jgi:hypothetical protein
MKTTEKAKVEAYESLKKYRGAQVGAVIKSVSRSGMARRIEFYAGDMHRITWDISQLLEYPLNDKGMLVTGCGMDMVFSVLSNLNYAMAQRDTGKTLQELLKTKECGERIYDTYFINANNYRLL